MVPTDRADPVLVRNSPELKSISGVKQANLIRFDFRHGGNRESWMKRNFGEPEVRNQHAGHAVFIQASPVKASAGRTIQKPWLARVKSPGSAVDFDFKDHRGRTGCDIPYPHQWRKLLNWRFMHHSKIAAGVIETRLSALAPIAR